MISIREKSEQLANEWALNEEAREIFYSMLDESDDDSPLIRTAEDERLTVKRNVDDALRDRSFIAKAMQRVPRKPTHPAISRRTTTILGVQGLTELYRNTSNARTKEVRDSAIAKYAFKVPPDATRSSVKSGDYPKLTWNLCFRKLVLSIGSIDIVWTERKYDEEGLLKWWRPRFPSLSTGSSSPSDGWSDMKRLARRVTIQILERLKSANLTEFLHITRLKMVAEVCREVVLNQIILFCNLPAEDLAELQDIFEHTVPVVYLACGIIKSSPEIPTNDVAKLVGIEKQLKRVDHLLRALRNKCYILGTGIGYLEREEYRDLLKKGRVFDFDHNADEKTGFIQLDPLIAGSSEQDRMKRMDAISQKQALVNENVLRSSHYPKTESKLGSLDRKALESIGLKEYMDIIFGSEVLLGRGGYAEVYRMERHGNYESVAVKKYKPDERTANRIEREARVWVKLQHRNIAPLLGFVYLTRNLPYLVSTPYHCDLKQLVNKSKNGRMKPDGKVLTIEQKLSFLRDVILGLEYLHASGIAHGDMRAANVLITNENFQDPSCYAVVNDFGMAEYYGNDIDSLLDNRDLSSINQRTSDFWLSPELIEAAPREGTLSRVSKEGDIYAFGIVFLEVIYERDPYEGWVGHIRIAKSTGELPADKAELDMISDSHWKLMQGCWDAVDKRFGMQHVVWSILDMVDQHTPRSPTNSEGPENAYWSRFLQDSSS